LEKASRAEGFQMLHKCRRKARFVHRGAPASRGVGIEIFSLGKIEEIEY
jgi:hypothetical protein